MGDAGLHDLLPHAAALADAPADWQARAVAAWRRPQPAPDRLAQVRTRLQALLQFDSWATAPLAAGLRSTGSATRQLVFSAEGRDVDLRIVPQGDTYAIRGQVLGPDDEGHVRLAATGGPADGTPARAADGVDDGRQTALDTLGEFHLGGITPGHYTLHLVLGDTEVALPAFQVGPAAGSTA